MKKSATGSLTSKVEAVRSSHAANSAASDAEMNAERQLIQAIFDDVAPVLRDIASPIPLTRLRNQAGRMQTTSVPGIRGVRIAHTDERVPPPPGTTDIAPMVSWSLYLTADAKILHVQHFEEAGRSGEHQGRFFEGDLDDVINWLPRFQEAVESVTSALDEALTAQLTGKLDARTREMTERAEALRAIALLVRRTAGKGA